MNYSIHVFPTATVEVPFPEVYWMEGFGDWARLQFQMALLRSEENTILINTGFPPDCAPLAEAWRRAFGERCQLQRPDEWKTEEHLRAAGVTPDSVGHVLLTPIQLYATGNLRLFPNSRIGVSRKGFIEDIIAPVYPHHVPRQGCLSDSDLFWLLGDNHSNLLLLEDRHEVLPGLVCHWIGVHHRSSMLIEVQTEKGIVMISDCAFHYANVEEQRPLGIAESIIEAHSAYAKIREEADIFIPLYDPKVQERFPGGRVA